MPIDIKRGESVIRDMKRMHIRPKLIFDVGANAGKYSRLFANTWPDADLYAFEPTHTTFSKLKQNTHVFNNIMCYRMAFGDNKEEGTLHINDKSVQNSFIFNPLGSDRSEIIEIETIDDFCVQNEIRTIDFLKIDTEGFDLKVLQGAGTLLGNDGIRAILIEVGLTKNAKRFVHIEKILLFLHDFNFSLYGLYDHYISPESNLLRRADGLFIHNLT